jgi:hypothetical protein
MDTYISYLPIEFPINTIKSWKDLVYAFESAYKYEMNEHVKEMYLNAYANSYA